MSFRISNIHEYDRFIALDLWSFRVRASLYSIKNGKLILEGVSSVRQHMKNMQGWNIMDMQWVSDVIDTAIREASRNLSEIPQDIIVAFSPATCIHDNIVSQYMRSDPDAPLTMEELDMMIEKIEKSSLERAKEKAKTEHGVIHDDIRLISSTLTHIMIDGKNVIHPIGITGKYVRINILNIFTLASEYNILRSIIASLKKKTISLVPTPLIFSKILEKWDVSHEDNLYIDIGYTHMTVVFEKNHEITSFDTFAIGSHMLMDMYLSELPDMTYTEIESLMMRSRVAPEDGNIREPIAAEYLHYVIDTLLSLIIKENESLKMKNIYISGGIFSSPWIEKLFFSILSESLGYTVRHTHLADLPIQEKISSEYIINHGLALLWYDLLLTKKDPIIRILRYTLYHYE